MSGGGTTGRPSDLSPVSVLTRLHLWRPGTDTRRFAVTLLGAAGAIVAVVWPVLAHSDLWAGNGGPILFHFSHAHALHIADIGLVLFIAASSWALATLVVSRRPPAGGDDQVAR